MRHYLRCLFGLFLFGPLILSSEELSPRGQVLQELSEAYTQSKYVSKAQLYSLEVRLAEITLEKVKSVGWIQKSDIKDYKLKDEITQAIYLYKKALNRVKDGEEKSKILFRIGYLYEILSSYSQAFDSYEQVLAVSRNSSRVSKARSLSRQMRKKLKKINDHYQKSSLKKESPLESALSQTRQNLNGLDGENPAHYFDKACQIYLQSQSCSHNSCRNFPESIKNLIHTAHNKKNKDLIQLYKIYLSYFPLDSVMVLSAAEWAAGLGQYAESLAFYQRHILFEQRFIRFSALKEEEKKEKFMHLENLFHLYHSLAQLSRNPNLEIQAYNFYLKHSVLRKSVFEIRYLKNKALFRMGQYRKTAPVFREIALSAYPDKHLRSEAAVFSLKALVKMNQNITAQKWAEEFSISFPDQKSDFQKII